MSNCLTPIKICALRATLLTALGDVAPGPNNYVVTASEQKLGYTADTDKGKDIFERNGCDNALFAYKSNELLKRFTLALDFIGLDAATQGILTGANVLDDQAGSPVGYEFALQDCPTDPAPPLVAIEAWSYAYVCDYQSPTTPYVYTIFPMCQIQATGEWTLQVDAWKPTFAGFTRRNTQWGHGPYGGIVQGASGAINDNLGSVGTFATSTPPPAAVCGFQTTTPSS